MRLDRTKIRLVIMTSLPEKAMRTFRVHGINGAISSWAARGDMGIRLLDWVGNEVLGCLLPVDLYFRSR